LTPLADLGRSAEQAPLHGLHAAGIAAAAGSLLVPAVVLWLHGYLVMDSYF
jgi:hypothetical protein